MVPNLFPNYDFAYTLKRNKVKEIIKPYLKYTLDLCDNLLNENKFDASNVDKIILVGGSCLSPIVKEVLAEKYEIPLEDSINPLTVVAKGASIYAGTLKKP
ncbi:Hsp70 family protein [uncultured Methanobrevibacter sp.]|uniref:Hsp70 family protein n=1 Tax=uncultured Methanobrevibacter sp. TaxID=253161 RepID=UPI0025D41EEF|nr:Hsp70 family protein [uncultured Methanobrevibacter sp.]